MPVVYGGRPVRERENAYYVDVDNIQGGRDATAYLIERGYRRIGTITGPLTMPAGIDRLQGFREALAAAGLEEVAVEDGDFTADGAADAMRRILEQGEQPGCPLRRERPHGPRRAGGALGGRIRVPEDVAIMGFDDSPVATSVIPQLTTMRQPSSRTGGADGERAARTARRSPNHSASRSCRRSSSSAIGLTSGDGGRQRGIPHEVRRARSSR